ncbi:hypothetical protein CN306_18805 [Bacillus thuringiensis]|uniref:hypothetical protein n=1 Tax=Bacillus thuringiensis TaxID=1428 RepID=UPI000BF2BBFC|nr:hypothetical protein [Bacillus thuringiensis]PEW46593.1 hypothetical protein CN444_15970 [Bacillus thuringiensis]PFD89221.1 hypothetical protein CN306_18805 [Bacillus thuringiensis]
MAFVQFKHESGVLHIGGGRFFYAGEPQEVTAKERDELLESYGDLEEYKQPKTKIVIQNKEQKEGE